MSTPRAHSAKVALESEEARTTLRELLQRVPGEDSAALSDLLAQTIIDSPLKSRYGDEIERAAIVAVLDDLASRVRELEA